MFCQNVCHMSSERDKYTYFLVLTDIIYICNFATENSFKF